MLLGLPVALLEPVGLPVLLPLWLLVGELVALPEELAVMLLL